mgnify:CR=1 FL=1
MKVVKSKFKFSGGSHPDYNKSLARDKAIEAIPMPDELVVLMSQHLGAPAKCLVKQGDFVAKGQVIGEKNGFISVCVHSPSDGLVKAVEKRIPGIINLLSYEITYNCEPLVKNEASKYHC